MQQPCNYIVILSSPHSKDDATDDKVKTHDSSSSLTSSTISTEPEKLITSSATIPPDRKQLLFLYDCETTGGSHYDEHIIEIGSVVILPDNLSVTQIEFSSLCHTSHRIDPQGINKTLAIYTYIYLIHYLYIAIYMLFILQHS